MAQREHSKARRVGARAGTASSRETSDATLEQRCKSLERERDELKAELEAARGEIARLDRVSKDVANRIDWVIDSLHNIVEGDR